MGATVMTVMKLQAALLQAVNFFSLGGWRIVRFQEVAEGNVEQGKESTWISLLSLIRAENKTEIQLERRNM